MKPARSSHRGAERRSETAQLGHARKGKERGASLVEFAFVMPFLLILVLGTVEFGWALTQHLDVRHLARETGRIATVDGTTSEITDRACAGDVVVPGAITTITRTGSSDRGEAAFVTVSADLDLITGFFGWLFGSSPSVSSTVEIRLEQDATAWDGSNLAPLSCP